MCGVLSGNDKCHQDSNVHRYVGSCKNDETEAKSIYDLRCTKGIKQK